MVHSKHVLQSSEQRRARRTARVRQGVMAMVRGWAPPTGSVALTTQVVASISETLLLVWSQINTTVAAGWTDTQLGPEPAGSAIVAATAWCTVSMTVTLSVPEFTTVRLKHDGRALMPCGTRDAGRFCLVPI